MQIGGTVSRQWRPGQVIENPCAVAFLAVSRIAVVDPVVLAASRRQFVDILTSENGEAIFAKDPTQQCIASGDLLEIEIVETGETEVRFFARVPIETAVGGASDNKGFAQIRINRIRRAG